MVIVDRFSGWIIAYYFKPRQSISTKLVDICRDIFITYGAPEELSSDGSPQFIAQPIQTLLKQWGIKHRLSSVGYAQSNGRAEADVKTVKRIIRDNISSDGSLNNNKAAAAILQYRNTPILDTKLSPAQILFHRQLRDSIPCHPSQYQLHPEWIIAAKEREEAFQKKHQDIMADYNRNTRPRELPSINPGTLVTIQGKDKRWGKQGLVVEQLDNLQYRVLLLGSGRISLQNRRFLRECTHIQPNNQILIPTLLNSPTDSVVQPQSSDQPPVNIPRMEGS